MAEIKNIDNEKFHLFISKYLDSNLSHYSHSDALPYQSFEEGVGKVIIQLACYVKAGVIYNLSEDKMDTISKSLVNAFKEKVVSKFVKSDVYKTVKYSGSMLKDDIASERLVFLAFTILISRAFEDNFKMLFPMLMDLIPDEIYSEKDSKTVLQELMQSKGLALALLRYDTHLSDKDSKVIAFTSDCYIDGAKFTGFGSSKKAAEQDAAHVACVSFKAIPKAIKLPTHTFHTSRLHINKYKYINEKISVAFGLPEHRNIIQAFVPARLRSTIGCNNSSHRKLATIGSVYIQYIKHRTFLENAKRGVLLDGDTVQSAAFETSNSTLSAIFQSTLPSKNDLSFLKDSDYFSTKYQVDCVQALFGMELLEFLDRKQNPLRIQNTKATDWLVKNIQNSFKKKLKINKNITSVLVERCGSLGFTFRFIRTVNSWGVEIESLKTKRKYRTFYKQTSSPLLRSEVLSALSAIVLKSLDRLEGYYFIEPKVMTSQKMQTELLYYFFDSMTDSFRHHKEISELALTSKNSNPDYSEYSKKDLIELWESNTLDIMGRANVLFLIHKTMNIIDERINERDYIFLPAVFRPFFDIKSFSITDIFSNKKEVGDEVVDRYRTSSKPDDKKQRKSIEPNSKEGCYVKSTDQEKSVSNEKAENDLRNYKNVYENMSLEDLELLWSNRLFEFDYTEEAAIVLSLVRYNRGIDFISIDYRELTPADIITELNLPSIYSSHISTSPIKEKNTNDNKKKTKVEITSKADNFTPNSLDERSFAKAKVAIRGGQSSFRANLITKWQCCNITGCSTINALDAAHITPYRGEKDNDIRNGLLLRADIHRLFDAYLIGINPNSLTIHISPKIDDPIYTQYEGKKISLGEDEDISLAAIQYHWLYYTNNIE